VKALIIIPTYNECENIREIVTAVLALPYDFEILVVDDNSPDGTGGMADGLAASDSRVHVLHRECKQGLGPAYIAGYKWGLARPEYDLFFEMDADFSHQPRFLPDFLNAIASNDVVLGARYIPGGGTVNWKLSRRLISRGGNLYARMVLGLWRYHDITGGFKCFRREVLEAIDLDDILQKGFGFQIELTYRAHLLGFRIAETPIIFPDREVGTSKMSGSIFKEALVNVWKLRAHLKRPRA